jgi:hypothetical protein
MSLGSIAEIPLDELPKCIYPLTVKTITNNFYKLGDIKKQTLIIFTLSFIIYWSVVGIPAICGQTNSNNFQLVENRTFINQTKHFLNHLTKASKDECAQIFDIYAAIISRELDLTNLYFASYEEVEDLLNRAVNETVDSLTLFTLPLLQKKEGSAIVFGQKLLLEVSNNFDFHGLFNISAHSVKNDTIVKMKFLVVGQGKFIVGYNKNDKIKHPDYNFATGNYDYNELFIMDAKNDSNGNPGLFNIKGLSNPNMKPHFMKGPLNVDIQSLTLTSNPAGQSQILIKYYLFGIKQKLIDPIPIEKLNNE